MKIKLVMTIVALMAFAVGASAQDAGDPDSVIVEFTTMPNMDTDDSLVVLDIIFAVYDDTVRSISTGYDWDFDYFEMDSAKWSTVGASAFPGFPLLWSQNDIDSTNHYKRFQATGFGFGAADLSTREVIVTFYGHVTRWEGTDAINITPGSFVAMAFVDASGSDEFPPVWGGDATIADVGSVNGLRPVKFSLAQNYPNPFNPTTRIGFDLPRKAHTTLTIFNVLGQRVTTLVDEDLAADRYEIEWNGTTDAGNQVASGIYFYRLNAGEKIMTKKMMLLK